jgi:hypothetical protein
MIVAWKLLLPEQGIDARCPTTPHAGGRVELSPPHRTWRMPGVRSLATNSRHASPTVRTPQGKAVLVPEADAAADAAAKKEVADLQQRAHGRFLLMYSRYWRRFIAIYLGESDHGIILQAARPDELWQLMDHVAPTDWQMDDLPLIEPARPSGTADVRGLLPALPGVGIG